MLKIVLLFLAFSGSIYNPTASELDSPWLLASPYDNHKIEVLWQNASSQGVPLLIFLHGASSEKGLQSISDGWFKHWIDKGYAVAAISLPGYGKSTGKKDFCGPCTLNSLHCAIDVLKEKSGVSRFGIIGFGQGGMAGVLLAAQRSDIDCVVCSNGGYDLRRHQAPEGAFVRALEQKQYDLDVRDADAFAARSPFLCISKINAPLYLLHRKEHPMVTEEEVLAFYNTMLIEGKECHLSLKESTPEQHAEKLSYQEVLKETELWVDNKMHR